MDGTWTDSTVNDTSGNYARNRNVPGDGKFDQSSFPAKIKLMIGRVDLANMPGVVYYGGPSTFPSELELLRNYLNKDHKFRTKQFDLPRRGIVGDQFGTRDGEAFCASGYRNFAPFFRGEQHYHNAGRRASGCPHSRRLRICGRTVLARAVFASVGGLGSATPYNSVLTRDIYNNDIKAVFTLLFGSWFGDWDSEDNIMRGVLAAPSYGPDLRMVRSPALVPASHGTGRAHRLWDSLDPEQWTGGSLPESSEQQRWPNPCGING
jgi:hypothetical protein